MDLGILADQLYSIMTKVVTSFRYYLTKQKADNMPRLEETPAEVYARLCREGALIHGYGREPQHSLYLMRFVHSPNGKE
ncbi:hypothetical protein HYV88_01295 [Candidatus Woesearchaeota archaeon]|nr:hypothetical protein [Candidatus Woesearchaeota archaeon]